MSREIKFRVFAKGVKKMLYFNNPGLAMCNFDEGQGYGMALRLVGGHAYLGEYSDLMQYTGMHDMNGKEVYEGDIVVCGHDTGKSYERYIMTFKEDSHAYLAYQQGTLGSYIGSGYWRDCLLVINIYDNPEWWR